MPTQPHLVPPLFLFRKRKRQRSWWQAPRQVTEAVRTERATSLCTHYAYVQALSTGAFDAASSFILVGWQDSLVIPATRQLVLGQTGGAPSLYQTRRWAHAVDLQPSRSWGQCCQHSSVLSPSWSASRPASPKGFCLTLDQLAIHYQSPIWATHSAEATMHRYAPHVSEDRRADCSPINPQSRVSMLHRTLRGTAVGDSQSHHPWLPFLRFVSWTRLGT